jgi:hypothetical protein
MLVAETFPREGGSLLLDWTMDLPTLAAEMTGEGAELMVFRPPPCRTTLSAQCSTPVFMSIAASPSARWRLDLVIDMV